VIVDPSKKYKGTQLILNKILNKGFLSRKIMPFKLVVKRGDFITFHSVCIHFKSHLPIHMFFIPKISSYDFESTMIPTYPILFFSISSIIGPRRPPRGTPT
jgi:hypothetical protein